MALHHADPETIRLSEKHRRRINTSKRVPCLSAVVMMVPPRDPAACASREPLQSPGSRERTKRHLSPSKLNVLLRDSATNSARRSAISGSRARRHAGAVFSPVNGSTHYWRGWKMGALKWAEGLIRTVPRFLLHLDQQFRSDWVHRRGSWDELTSSLKRLDNTVELCWSEVTQESPRAAY